MNLPIRAESATDAVKKSVAYVKEHGEERIRWGGTIPAKLGVGGDQNFDRLMLEVPFLCVELRRPSARWTNIGNQAFITLAETEDHLAGRNPGILPKYSKLYREWLREDTGDLPYTYGERIYYEGQLGAVVDHLRKHPNSRKALIQVRGFGDIRLENPPCNVMFQLEVLDGKLNWTTINRSQDIINGMSENIFMFTLWQSLVASLVGVPMGVYRIVSTNAHLYQKHFDMDLSVYKDPYQNGYNANWEPTWPMPNFQQFNARLFEDENYSPEKVKEFGVGREGSVRDLRGGAIPDLFWSAWKAALVAEWALIHGDTANSLTALEMASAAPWAGPVARRLLESLPDAQTPEKVEEFMMQNLGSSTALLNTPREEMYEKVRKIIKLIPPPTERVR